MKLDAVNDITVSIQLFFSFYVYLSKHLVISTLSSWKTARCEQTGLDLLENTVPKPFRQIFHRAAA
jgi:hypothetical protein